MKIGLISDTHGNLSALNEALTKLKDAGVDFIYSAGDIVGYGPNPEECIDIFEKNAITSVFGNHDFAVNHPEVDAEFNAYARFAIEWTREKLSNSAKSYLNSLPMFIEKEDFTIFHGALDKEEPFSYILMPADSEISFQNLKTQVGFFGHSHIPGCFVKEESGIINYFPAYPGCSLHLKENTKYLINVGSVGQPRDGNPAGSYCIFDTNINTIRMDRFNYDIDSVYTKIVERGLPRFLGERLYSGV